MKILNLYTLDKILKVLYFSDQLLYRIVYDVLIMVAELPPVYELYKNVIEYNIQ
ncbi:hypothetical protein [Clostridium butyricum]|uniref:hypothetical protein n=1 Tax=Clostridium butyricum TaxID=1492 RepID=UPI00189186CD|nr:hypothetical protein [Clostridium butyricum]